MMKNNVIDDKKIVPVYSSEIIKVCVRELASKISEDFKNSDIILIGLLNSSVFFLSDLIREIERPVFADFLSISSYGTVENISSPVKILKDISESLENKSVILVDTIVETGFTLDFAIKHVKSFRPARLKTCALIDLRASRLVDVPIDYSGFISLETGFAGYGIDINGNYRNVPFIFQSDFLNNIF